ncbi:hypothetical protein A0256_24310 [Mucilaginibacter sp. PAMC 26640]|nr:hypothetical protein A0256_24310 [Mucilaginibacter sp. PAMC 26640]
MTNTAADTSKSDKPVWYFILCWTLLNLVQAYTLELHGDEAYYWVYAQKLDWGYFYHPPMMALFIKIGYTLLHNELGIRLMAVFTNSAAIYLLRLILKPYRVSPHWFILAISSVLVFHVYGFTTTPDAPLFFFAVLFYYVYQRYITKDGFLTGLLMGVIAACLLYSKYHGVLVIGFTVLSNFKLFKRGSFYLAMLTALIILVPHILWQMHHGFPAVNYQLFERSTDRTYKIGDSIEYLSGQLLLGGVLSSWYLFYKGFTAKVSDAFTRTLMFNAIGTFAFFLVNTLNADVQPHYTLIAFGPLTALALINFSKGNLFPVWYQRLLLINIGLVLLLRVALLFQWPVMQKIQALDTYFGYKKWAMEIHKKAGNAYMVMDDGFQNPSKYNFYNHTLKGFSYDSRYYGRTMYDIWPFEDSLQHKRVYGVFTGPIKGVTTDMIPGGHNIYYGGWIEDARTYQKVAIEASPEAIAARPGQKIQFDLKLTNPYPFDITFANEGYKHKAFLEACFFKGKTDLVALQQADSTFNGIALKKGATATYKMTVTTPPVKGKYYLVFSIRTEPFSGSKNSPLIKFLVE